MEKIGDIIRRVLKNPSADFSRKETAIIDWEKLWSEICGDEARHFSHAVGYTGGILTVSVTNSCWLMELKKQKSHLKKALEQRSGMTVSDIRFIR